MMSGFFEHVELGYLWSIQGNVSSKWLDMKICSSGERPGVEIHTDRHLALICTLLSKKRQVPNTYALLLRDFLFILHLINQKDLLRSLVMPVFNNQKLMRKVLYLMTVYL